jgi:hypothetical protein
VCPQQPRRRHAIDKQDTARGSKRPLQGKSQTLFAYSRANVVAVLNHEYIGRNVEKPIQLITIAAKVCRLHRVEARWPLE